MQNWLVSPPEVAKEEMFSQGVSVISYEKVTALHLVTPVINHLKKKELKIIANCLFSPCSPSGPGWTVRMEL